MTTGVRRCEEDVVEAKIVVTKSAVLVAARQHLRPIGAALASAASTRSGTRPA